LAHKIVVAKPQTVLSEIVIDEQTVFVLMTHNYNYDLAVLRELIKTECAYIGSLGPRKKLERMLDELKEEGITFSKDQLSKIYGPVGLDIGAEAAEEIALSILSEIKAVLSNRQGQFLRDRSDTIHAESSLNMSSQTSAS
jgi:xanthine/CO dehydrogenase XdhC/CoxF family maturation factor